MKFPSLPDWPAKYDCGNSLYTAEQMRQYAREAVQLNAAEPPAAGFPLAALTLRVQSLENKVEELRRYLERPSSGCIPPAFGR